MEQQNALSEGQKKRRQLLLVLPLLILPFMTLAFWALGGARRSEAASGSGGAAAGSITGINSNVPRARAVEVTRDKMTLYAQADREAAAKQNRVEAWGRFRYPDAMDGDTAAGSERFTVGTEADSYGTPGEGKGKVNVADADADLSSRRIKQKLADLHAVLKRAETTQQAALTMPGLGHISPAAADHLQTERSVGAKGGEGMDHGGYATGNESGLAELGQLKDLIAQSADVNSTEDTRQINAMLDKILAIQHPAAAASSAVSSTESSAEPSAEPSALSGSVRSSAESRRGIYPVTRVEDEVHVPLLTPATMNTLTTLATPAGKAAPEKERVKKSRSGKSLSVKELGLSAGAADSSAFSGAVRPAAPSECIAAAFYDLDTPDDIKGTRAMVSGHTAMAAVVAGNQTLVSGGTVKMRLKTDVMVHGRLMPKGSFVYGVCRVNGERLNIDIRHIRLKDQLFSVKLQVFDLDGMAGIHIPGSISRDAAKQGADRGLGRMQMLSMDPSVAAQAATAGMEAAKGLLSKKVKLVRVTVKAGYPILLLDSKG